MKTVTMQELAQRASVPAGISMEASKRFLEAAISIMRDEVMRGNRVVLPNLATLEPGAEASVEAKLDVPIPAAAPAAGPGVAPPAAAPATAVVVPAAPPAAGLYMVMLVVPAQDMFTNITARKLSGPNRAVTVVEGVQNAIRQLGELRTDVMIIDGNLPDVGELVSAVKLSRSRGIASVVLIHPEGVAPNRVVRLKVCEDEYVQEPFDVADLAKLVDSEIERISEERNFFEQEVHFQFQTTEECVEQSNDLMARLVDEADLDEEKAASLSVAFREAVDNAARHGNKSQETRIIDVIFLLDNQKVTATVEDEGGGFDTELYLTRGIQGNAVAVARERNQAGRVGGLGIMLMLKCLDDLEYNYVGNLVKLTKYR